MDTNVITNLSCKKAQKCEKLATKTSMYKHFNHRFRGFHGFFNVFGPTFLDLQAKVRIIDSGFRGYGKVNKLVTLLLLGFGAVMVRRLNHGHRTGAKIGDCEQSNQKGLDNRYCSWFASSNSWDTYQSLVFRRRRHRLSFELWCLRKKQACRCSDAHLCIINYPQKNIRSARRPKRFRYWRIYLPHSRLVCLSGRMWSLCLLQGYKGGSTIGPKTRMK